MLEKKEKRLRRHRRIRAKIKGDSSRPRLCVFRSNKHIYAQLIDDLQAKTLLSASDLELPQEIRETRRKKEGKVGIAHEVGKLIAKKAREKGIKEVVFDRGGFKYHGRVKALAEGAREGGLKF